MAVSSTADNVVWFQVTNSISDNLVLIVHCQSKDDDLRATRVPVGSELKWRFSPAIFASTLFWCNVAVRDKRLSFAAYEELEPNVYPRAVYWEVMDDGVYRKYNNTDPKFVLFSWNS
ncbi:Self-incompatibility protein S1 [Linum perenne]